MSDTDSRKTIFQLVYKVLSDLYPQVQAAFGDKADAAISERVGYLQSAYNKLNDGKQQPIDYSDPTTRFAYVYKYVASHASYVRDVLHMVREQLSDELFLQPKLVVSCLGGGPGSEMVGFLQYVLEKEDCKTGLVTCYLCDREQAWADSWTEVGQELDSDINVHANFQQLDVTAAGSWAKQRKFLSADLFLCSYFVSEIARFKEQADAFWREIAVEAKPGAKILFIDNDHTSFTDYIRQRMKGTGFELVAFNKIVITPRWDEEKSDFGDFLKKFGHSPKLKSQMAYHVFIKK